MQPLVPLPIQYVSDQCMKEGHVIVPFALDFTNLTTITVDLANITSLRPLSCVKGISFDWTGLNESDSLALVVQGTTQAINFGSNNSGSNVFGTLELFTVKDDKLVFTKVNGLVGGKGTFFLTNFEVEPFIYTAESSGSAVASFNNRVGAVMPLIGDYTAAQVTNAADVTAANTFAGLQTINNVLDVNNQGYGSQQLAAFLQPNLNNAAANQNASLVVGQSLTNQQAVEISYNTGAGGANNSRAMIGVYGSNPLTVDDGGQVVAARFTPVGLPDNGFAIVLGASPASYNAYVQGQILIAGGTVTAIAITRAGVSYPTGVLAGPFRMSLHDTIVVTYTTVPTVNFLPA